MIASEKRKLKEIFHDSVEEARGRSESGLHKNLLVAALVRNAGTRLLGTDRDTLERILAEVLATRRSSK